MKKQISAFLAGMLFASIIGSVSAFAISSRMTIEVDPINVQVNGAIFAPKDATGKDVPVFAYEGTTYAPLRALAEAYGLKVGYDTEKNMATVNSANASQASINTEEYSDVDLAQTAYTLIDNAEYLCKHGVATIKSAWRFGIYDAPNCTVSTVIDRLAAQIGFDSAFVKEHCGYTADELVNGTADFPAWEYCLWATENCFTAYGTYDTIDQSMELARNLIQSLPESYLHYKGLKNYFTKVAEYVDFFEDVTGSYNELSSKMFNYEFYIDNAKEPLLFDFR